MDGLRVLVGLALVGGCEALSLSITAQRSATVATRSAPGGITMGYPGAWDFKHGVGKHDGAISRGGNGLDRSRYAGLYSQNTADTRGALPQPYQPQPASETRTRWPRGSQRTRARQSGRKSPQQPVLVRGQVVRVEVRSLHRVPCPWQMSSSARAGRTQIGTFATVPVEIMAQPLDHSARLTPTRQSSAASCQPGRERETVSCAGHVHIEAHWRVAGARAIHVCRRKHAEAGPVGVGGPGAVDIR